MGDLVTHSENVMLGVRLLIDRELPVLKGQISQLKLAAGAAGAVGGSRIVLHMAAAAQRHAESTADAVVAFLRENDGQNLAEYPSAVKPTLDEAHSHIEELFTAADKQRNPKAIENLGIGLKSVVERTINSLEIAAGKQAPTVDARAELTFAILRHFSKNAKAHRINVIGRTYQPGALDGELGRSLSSEDRGRANGIISELIKDELLEPTLDDMADPQSWLKITDAGREVLSRGTFDELEARLSDLAPNLIELRRGAWSAVSSQRPDSLRHAAHSARELITQVLDAVAPTAAILAQPGFQPSKEGRDGITRRMRYKFAIENRTSGMSETDVEITERAAELLEAIHKKLSAHAHTRTGSTSREMRLYLQTMDVILSQMLL